MKRWLRQLDRRARRRLRRELTELRCPRVSISLPPSDTDRSYELVVCAVFNSEARYLREWIEYHRIIGVEKFVMFNNRSRDDWRSVLEPYIAQGVVTVYDLPRFRGYSVWRQLQRRAYSAAVDLYRGRARWMAFIDTDEFLNPQTCDSVTEFLRDYEEYPALAVHWMMFSTSGHILRPETLVTEAYTACRAEGTKHVKLIVDPARTVEFVSAHSARFAGGATAVNERCEPIERGYSRSPTVAKIRLNHYYTRSVEDYLAKLGRQPNYKGGRSFDMLMESERIYATDVDTSIQRFLPRLRDAMQMAASPTAAAGGGA